MIILEKYCGYKAELLQRSAFREFNLPETGANYTTNSLAIIYEMYCKLLKIEYGLFFVEFNVSVPDSAKVCNESVIDYLFHRVQENIQHRKSHPGNTTGLLWKSYREGFSTNHTGYFFIPIIKGDLDGKSKGSKGLLTKEILETLGEITSQFHNNFTEEVKAYFSFHGKEGEEGVLCNSSFEAKEKGFSTLCKIAQLYLDELNFEPPLLTARYGCEAPVKPLHYSLS